MIKLAEQNLQELELLQLELLMTQVFEMEMIIMRIYLIIDKTQQLLQMKTIDYEKK
jgi:hypothetical protein